jgi:hypothetical protein
MGLFRYGDLYNKYTEGEKILKDFQMPSVEALLFFYKNHYQTLFSIVPVTRRIVYSTSELKVNIPSICRFLGITSAYLNLANLQMNTGNKKHHVVAALDRTYLKEKVDFYCGDLHVQLKKGGEDINLYPLSTYLYYSLQESNQRLVD